MNECWIIVLPKNNGGGKEKRGEQKGEKLRDAIKLIGREGV